MEQQDNKPNQELVDIRPTVGPQLTVKRDDTGVPSEGRGSVPSGPDERDKRLPPSVAQGD